MILARACVVFGLFAGLMSGRESPSPTHRTQ